LTQFQGRQIAGAVADDKVRHEARGAGLFVAKTDLSKDVEYFVYN
jgi:hypothetical protein